MQRTFRDERTIAAEGLFALKPTREHRKFQNDFLNCCHCFFCFCPLPKWSSSASPIVFHAENFLMHFVEDRLDGRTDGGTNRARVEFERHLSARHPKQLTNGRLQFRVGLNFAPEKRQKEPPKVGSCICFFFLGQPFNEEVFKHRRRRCSFNFCICIRRSSSIDCQLPAESGPLRHLSANANPSTEVWKLTFRPSFGCCFAFLAVYGFWCVSSPAAPNDGY